MLSSSMSNFGNPPKSESCGIPGSPPPIPPNIFDDEDIEVELDDVTELEEKELILEEEEPFIKDEPLSIPSMEPGIQEICIFNLVLRICFGHLISNL